MEGERRNAGLDACTGNWILEVDADEHVTPSLADEIRDQIDSALYDWCDIPIDNYAGAPCAGKTPHPCNGSFQCYFGLKGYKEGGMGLLIALCVGLYPLLSHLKARYDGSAL